MPGSRYRGNKETCPWCGIRYGDFRCSVKSWSDAFDALKDYSEDRADWKDKSRGVVLGYWFEVKQKEWKEHQEECEKNLDYEVPF